MSDKGLISYDAWLAHHKVHHETEDALRAELETANKKLEEVNDECNKLQRCWDIELVENVELKSNLGLAKLALEGMLDIHDANRNAKMSWHQINLNVKRAQETLITISALEEGKKYSDVKGICYDQHGNKVYLEKKEGE